MSKPRILFWDIETSYMQLAAWGLLNKYMLSPDNIIQDWYMLCAAYKWGGQKRIHATSILSTPRRYQNDPTDDYHVVKTMRDVISEADAVVAHYGDAFDMKKLKARIAYHDLEPIPKVIQIDTCKMAKRIGAFTSNKLNYLAHHFGFIGKIETNNKLWLRCLAGEKKAIREMVTYNKQDVTVLEQVYHRLLKYDHQKKFNYNLFTSEHVCPDCGSTHLQNRGWNRTKTHRYPRYQCMECGTWSQGNKCDKENKAEIK